MNFKNLSLSLSLRKVSQTEMQSSKLYASIHVTRNHRPFSEPTFSNGVELFGGGCLVLTYQACQTFAIIPATLFITGRPLREVSFTSEFLE